MNKEEMKHEIQKFIEMNNGRNTLKNVLALTSVVMINIVNLQSLDLQLNRKACNERCLRNFKRHKLIF